MMNATRTEYEAHAQMQAGAAVMRAHRAECAQWVAVLAERDNRRASRRAAKPAPTGFARILALLF